MSGLPVPDQVQDVLKQILQPKGNEDLQKATAYLRTYLKLHQCVPVLFQLLGGSTFVEVRQLAGVLLRRAIVGHWMKLDEGLKNELKKGIFVILTSEQNRLVRVTNANLVSIVVRIVLNSDEDWDSLVPSLFEVASSPSAEHREAALFVFESLLQEQAQVGEHFRPFFSRLYELFQKSLCGEDTKVRSAAIRAIGATIPWLVSENELQQYRSLIPPMLGIIKNFIQTGANEEAINALSIFDDIVEAPTSVLKSSITMLVNFVLEIGQTKTIHLNVRQEALTIIQWLAQYKSKQLLKNNFIAPVLQVAFQMCAEPEHEGADEWDITAHKFGTHIIDKMARHVSPPKVFTESMKWINGFIDSKDPNERKAALGALMILPRGCADIMTENLQSLLPYLYKGMADSDHRVRQVACLTLGQFSENLQPNIIDNYKEILPIIFQAMNEPNPEIQERSCYALVAFLQCAVSLEMLNEEIVPYLDPLMNRLVDLLKVSGNKDIQEMAISGISATAHCAGMHFLPYCQTVLEMMKELMLITDVRNIELRCRATECAGIVALAIKKEAFQPYLSFFMEYASNGLLQSGLDELRDYTYGFFANIAEMMGPDFKDYLGGVMPLVLAGCDSTDGITLETAGEEAALAEVFDENSEDEEKNEIFPKNYTVSQSFVDEKLQALHALSLLAYNCGAAFLPYLDRCMKSVLFLMRYIHPLIRKAALQPAESFVTIISKAYPPKTGQWRPGVSGDEQPLSEETRAALDSLMPLFIKNILSDHDKTVVYSTCETIKQLLKLLGPAAIESRMSDITSALLAVFQKQTTCQTLYSDSSEEGENGIYDGDEEEQDNVVLFQNTCEVVSQLAKLFKERFVNYFVFVEALSEYVKPTVDSGLRQEAIGTIAEITQRTGPAIVNKLDFMMQLVLTVMQDPHLPTRSNATFCCGLLCEFCGTATAKYLGQIYNYLPSLLAPVPYLALPDNAAALIGRVITHLTPRGVPVPLEQLLPALIGNLPLKKDFEENKVVYGAVFFLFNAGHPSIAPFIPKLVELFTAQLGNTTIQEEIKVEMAKMIKAIVQKFPQQIEPVIRSLSTEQKQNLDKCLQL